MGKSRRSANRVRSKTLPSSPSHSFSSSSSSSEFEFRVSISPRKNSSTHLCPADELFYKGQLLPLQLSPRLSMVRTLLLSSSSTSSFSDTTTNSSSAASRDSSGSSSSSDVVLFADYNSDSSRPSSVTEDEEINRLKLNGPPHQQIKKSKYHFSLPKFSSVFKKGPVAVARIDSDATTSAAGSSSVKRMSASAKEVIRKYVKKVKPLYEKFSHKQKMHAASATTYSSTTTSFLFPGKLDRSRKDLETYTRILNKENPLSCFSNSSGKEVISHSFSGNLRYPRRRSCVSSCPSSMRSSPSHSGVLSKTGLPSSSRVNGYSDSSSMEELQSAIQGAIAHCKNSMVQNNKSLISNEI